MNTALKEKQVEKKTCGDTPVLLDFRSISSCETPPRKVGEEARVTPKASRTAAQRGELKYLLDEETYRAFRAATQAYLEPDLFAVASIRSLYLDTPENAIIRKSLEKPAYKEKLRIRTYAENPGTEDRCFLEIKKKLKGTVYKRRVEMSISEAFTFCQSGSYPDRTLRALSDAERFSALQSLKEAAWFFSRYGALQPSFLVSCRRLSLKERGTESLRITFDRDLCWSYGSGGQLRQGETALIDPEARIMEVKSTKGLPFWLVEILNELEIHPRSFSKVGNSYRAWSSEMKGN